MTAQELPNGFTGFANKKPGFVPASNYVGHTSVGAGDKHGPSLASSLNQADHGAQGAFQYARDHARSKQGLTDFDPEKLRKIPQIDRRWAWTEIDLNALRHNAVTMKQHVGSGVRMMGVVKADAYGHGAARCAKTLLNSGAEYLGVATIDEAIVLREALVNAPILVLSQPPLGSIPLFLAYKVMPSIYTPDFAIQYAEAADAAGMRAPYHLAVNTGMNRIGVQHEDVIEFLSQVSFHRALDLVGTFTHFATADMLETFDFNLQVKRFIETIQAMRVAGIDPGIIHAANSAATIRFPDVHFDMVRPGVALYGLHPSQLTRTMLDLRPVMSVHARVTDTRFVAVSEGVSYGLTYRSPGSVKICTIPLGYADGLRRGLSDKTDFIVQGQRVRQVGSICMDQAMFEVDLRVYGTRQRLDPQIGDEVVVVGKQGNSVVTLDDMAYTLDTINYEVALGFSYRMPKIYK